jgi:hypothetical protein
LNPHRPAVSSQPKTQAKESFCTNAAQRHAHGKIGLIMKPRCTWTGHLKLSLVTVPVRVYTAISTADKVAF